MGREVGIGIVEFGKHGTISARGKSTVLFTQHINKLSLPDLPAGRQA